MAEAAETLLIKIGVDLVDLKKGLDEVSKDFKKMDTEVKSSASKMSGSLVSLAKSVVGLVAAYASATTAIRVFQNAIATTTQLDNLSQTTGVSVQALTELRAVALQTGVSFDTLSQALSQFGPRMTEALASPTSRGSQALRALGVDVRDAAGNIRTLDDLLPELAGAFSRFADGSNKAALAAALFGEEAGPRLIPLLNRGRAGLEELRRAVGTTSTQEDIQRVRTFNEAIGRLTLEFDKLSNEVVRVSAGPLSVVIDVMARSIALVRQAPEAVQQYVGALAQLTRRTASVQAELAKLDAAYAVLQQRIMRGEELTVTERDEFRKLTADIGILIERLRLLGLERQRLIASEGLPRGFVTTVTPHRPEAPALDPFALERAQFALERMQERLSGTRLLLDEESLSWQAYASTVTQALAQISETQAQGHQQEMARHRIRRQQQMLEQQAITQTATVAAQALTTLFPKSKAAAIAAAILNTAVAITNALSTGIPPWNMIQAGLIAAMGAHQIATIRATTESGGPTPTLGGGQGQAPEEGEAPRQLFISGINRSDLYSGQALADLMDAINNQTVNGRVLIATTIK